MTYYLKDPPPPVTLAEAKSWLRIETANDDAQLTALVRAAAGMCERFTGLALIARDVEEAIPALPRWRRLGLAPVSAITAIVGLPADGASFALPVGDYAIDIDGDGAGHVRVIRPGAAGRVRVSYRAGIAESTAGVPEALRHGVARLAGHLFENRSEQQDEPPEAVVSLWRPYRRMRLR